MKRALACTSAVASHFTSPHLTSWPSHVGWLFLLSCQHLPPGDVARQQKRFNDHDHPDLLQRFSL
jgi:hypothetical protein